MNARLCVRESINADFILFRACSDALCVHGALIKAEYLYATVFRTYYTGKEAKNRRKGGKGVGRAYVATAGAINRTLKPR